jgi:hypothetical protein
MWLYKKPHGGVNGKSVGGTLLLKSNVSFTSATGKSNSRHLIRYSFLTVTAPLQLLVSPVYYVMCCY